jgi:hypothetical protein
MNKDVLDKAYEYYNRSKLNVTNFTDTKVVGTLNAKEDGLLYLSVRYEEGWTVKIDGEKTDTIGVAGAMIGVDVKKGEHTVEMNYMPKGLLNGIAISCGSVLLLMALFVVEKLRKPRRSYKLRYMALFTTDIPKNRKNRNEFEEGLFEDAVEDTVSEEAVEETSAETESEELAESAEAAEAETDEKSPVTEDESAGEAVAEETAGAAETENAETVPEETAEETADAPAEEEQEKAEEKNTEED